MENHEKLAHLSQKEIEEVVSMYQEGRIKISEILERFNIDVKPGKLLQILPPEKTEKVCEMCGEYMYRQLAARTSSFKNRNDYFCLKCGHKEFVTNKQENKVCSCEGCTTKRKMLYQSKRDQINDVYGKDKEKIKFQELKVVDQIKLIYILLHNHNRNICEVAPMEESKTNIEYLNRLTEINALTVSPDSSIDSFCTEKFPYIYYVTQVTYNVNVEFKPDELDGINGRTYFIDNSSEEELIRLLKHFVYEDLIGKFEEMMKVRRLDLHISENGKEKFIELIEKLSYTQILTLCNKVAVFFSDKVLIGNMNRKVAKNAALSNVSKFYERAMESGWEIHHAEIENVRKELEFYIVRVLNCNLQILKEVASVENLKNWRDKEKDYNSPIGYAEK